MNDLEICKRIAEIEGLEIDNDSAESDECFYLFSSAPRWIINNFGLDERCKSFTFNPLTDKALCFDFMVKYEILLSSDSLTGWKASFFYHEFDEHIGEFTDVKAIFNESPQRAICLAIISKYGADDE